MRKQKSKAEHKNKASKKDASNKKSKLIDASISAFKDEKVKEYAPDYLSEIRSNWQKVAENIRRMILFLILGIVAFLLLQRSAIQEISLGPIKLGELTFVHRMIPAFIAYCFYIICNWTLMLATYRVIHTNITNLILPSLVKNDIEKFMTPPYFSIFGDITFVQKSFKFYKLFDFLQKIYIVIVIFGSIVFEIYAFYSLFVAFGSLDFFVWLSLIIAIILLAMGFLLVIAHVDVN